MLSIGSLVDGKYRILSEIGHGGMSVVYMAINEKANKTWAIKEVRKDGVLDFEAVRQGLIVETDMLKKLKHSHLPSIVDVIEDDNTLLIVMDYIEGRPLSNALKEFGAQPQATVVDWAKQLCDVLGYLHSREPAIIYRDMKPANVMLRPDGNLMLIDFGTAREYKEKNIADTTCLGTIGYAAPEQYGGMGQTDARTDIYCLGATLYHLITGVNPSEPPYEIKPIRELNPNLSSGLERIILKCVRKDPDERYQSCAELMYDLNHYEEIDDEFRKKQMKKLGGFIASVVATLVALGIGIGARIGANAMATDTYVSLLEEASRATDYEQKIALYIQAIDVPNKGGDSKAYLNMINAYKENDSVFTVDEQNILVKAITNHQAELRNNKEQYVEICFETGKLFWYYYNYGDGSDNRTTRMKSAIQWFDDVIQNAPKEYQNLGMATVYSEIGKFYRDIPQKVLEASDKGAYIAFFDTLSTLLQDVCEDNNESEIVQLELLELSRSALQQYATKLKADGISHEQLSTMYSTIQNYLNQIETTTDMTDEKKASTLNLMKDTKTAIDIAYSTIKGEEKHDG